MYNKGTMLILDCLEDLEAAFLLSEDEFKNCCNWWYSLIMWKKRELTKEDKIHLGQAAFNLSPAQLNSVEEGGATKFNEPIGVRVIK